MAAGTAAFGTLDTWLVWKLTQGGTFVTGTHGRVVLRVFCGKGSVACQVGAKLLSGAMTPLKVVGSTYNYTVSPGLARGATAHFFPDT
jgi:hypothetical protein